MQAGDEAKAQLELTAGELEDAKAQLALTRRQLDAAEAQLVEARAVDQPGAAAELAEARHKLEEVQALLEQERVRSPTSLHLTIALSRAQLTPLLHTQLMSC